MSLFSLSLGTLLLALAVAATPLAHHGHGSLRRGPKTHDAYNFLPSNKARTRNLITRDSSPNANAPRSFNTATYDTGEIHCIPVGIGIPPTTCMCDPWHAYATLTSMQTQITSSSIREGTRLMPRAIYVLSYFVIQFKYLVQQHCESNRGVPV